MFATELFFLIGSVAELRYGCIVERRLVPQFWKWWTPSTGEWAVQCTQSWCYPSSRLKARVISPCPQKASTTMRSSVTKHISILCILDHTSFLICSILSYLINWENCYIWIMLKSVHSRYPWSIHIMRLRFEDLQASTCLLPVSLNCDVSTHAELETRRDWQGGISCAIESHRCSLGRRQDSVLCSQIAHPYRSQPRLNSWFCPSVPYRGLLRSKTKEWVSACGGGHTFHQVASKAALPTTRANWMLLHSTLKGMFAMASFPPSCVATQRNQLQQGPCFMNLGSPRGVPEIFVYVQ